MSVQELADILREWVNDVTFTLGDIRCGITATVENCIPTYQAWCGDQIKEYSDVDELMKDEFFLGKSLKELAENTMFDVF